MSNCRKEYPREYRIWKAMRARCHAPCNKNHGSYQSNQINVCKEWDSFEQFITDMGPCPSNYSIDRIDNNGDYCKENCRWASADIQAKNRGSFNKYYTYNGETMCLKDWARKLGIKYITLQMRTIRHPEMTFKEIVNFKNESQRVFEYNGNLYTRTELCEKFNVSKKTFYDRMHKGWPLERILNTPILTSKYDKRNYFANYKKKGSEL